MKRLSDTTQGDMAVKKVRNLLPPDVEFYEDIRLVVWRPRGLLNSAAFEPHSSGFSQPWQLHSRWLDWL